MIRRTLVASLFGVMLASVATEAPAQTIDKLYEEAKKEGVLTFYTSQVASAEQKIAQAFKKKYPGINVEVIYAGGGVLFEKIRAEAQAGRDIADIHVQSDLPLMEKLREANLLAQYDAPEAAAFPPAYRKDGYWTGFADFVNVIAYNKVKVKADAAPKRWADLLDPKWSGRTASVHIGGGGLPWVLYYYFRKQLDPNFWTKFAALKPQMFDGGGAVANAVASGKADLGLVAGSSSYSAIADGAPLVNILPAEGVPGVTFTIAILKAAKHPNAARLFVNWYLSKEGQTEIVRIRGVDSPRKDVEAPPGRTSAGATKIIVPDVKESEAVRAEWTKEWFEIFRSGR